MTATIDTPQAAAEPPRRGGHNTQQRRDRRLAYLLITPAVLLELLIHIIPMLLGIWVAFLELDQRSLRNWLQAPFVWFDNFVRGLDPASAIGSEFFGALARTALYTVLVLGISWVLAMSAAVFLTSKFRGRGLVRTLFLAPFGIPGYVGALAWAFMLNRQDGLVNQVIVDWLGLTDERPFWLIGDNAFISLVVVSVWSMWPFAFLMLLAALQNVPTEIYEAASIDGASNWKQFVTITLPLIRHANAALVLILGLWLFNQFNVSFILFGATAPDQALLISPLIYQNSFQLWDFGVGGAMSVLLLIALLIVSVFYIRLVLPKGSETVD